MKTIFITFFLFLATTAIAEVPSEDAVVVSRILLNNPKLTDELAARYVDRLTDFQALDSTQKGIYEYKLTFEHSGFVKPVKAVVLVTEDTSATIFDGAVDYKFKTTYK